MTYGVRFLCQLLDRDEFRCITKIKTIGSTYMAAAGLTPESNMNGYSCRKVSHRNSFYLTNMKSMLLWHFILTAAVSCDDSKRGSCVVVPQPEEQSLTERWQHLADLADFALAMKVTLNNLNKQSFNNFMLRIGWCMLVCVCAHSQACVCSCFHVDALQV